MKVDYLPDLVRFYWTMKELVRDAIYNIGELNDSHTAMKAKHRYAVDAPELLTDIITPALIKLTQHKDSKGMADLGPFYSPIYSPDQSPAHSPINPPQDDF